MASFISRRRRINCVRFSLPLGGATRPLADVLRLAVDVHDQRLQLGLEADVVVRAAQPPLAAELVERDAAYRASLLVQPGQLFRRLTDRHLLRQHGRHARPRPSARWTTPSDIAGRGPHTGAILAACRRSIR